MFIVAHISICLIDHDPFKNSSRRPSIQRRERAIDVTFKGKTLTELKEEFEQKCAEIDKEHPELARKEGNRWNKLHEILKDRDAKAIINHNENIDTLLVFVSISPPVF